jgi:hypothetical protein
MQEVGRLGKDSGSCRLTGLTSRAMLSPIKVIAASEAESRFSELLRAVHKKPDPSGSSGSSGFFIGGFVAVIAEVAEGSFGLGFHPLSVTFRIRAITATPRFERCLTHDKTR